MPTSTVPYGHCVVYVDELPKTPLGWQCPACASCYAPWVPECWVCNADSRPACDEDPPDVTPGEPMDLTP